MIWYSHINEDSLPEIKYSKGFQDIICVVGSGERVISLLNNDKLKNIYAVDVNSDAIELLKLKLTALRDLEIEKYLGFVGSKKMDVQKRLDLLKRCLSKMDESSNLFWEDKINQVGKGILFIGHFEQFLEKIRPLLRLVLGNSFLIALRNDYEKLPFYRWKVIKSLFSSKIVYKLFGNKDISFIGDGSDTSRISNGFQKLIDEKQLHNSFMAHLVFNGSLKEMKCEVIPFTQNPEKLSQVQKKLRNSEVNISFEHIDILSFLKTKFSKISANKVFLSMSDILSFETQDYFIKCLRTFSDSTPCNATFAIRSYLKNHLKEKDFFKICLMGYNVEDISFMDKSYMYKVNIISKS